MISLELPDPGDLRLASAHRLDLRSASDARDTKTAYAVHENARYAGFTKRGDVRCPLLDNRLWICIKIDDQTKLAAGQPEVIQNLCPIFPPF